MNWTDERVEALKTLWAEGLSASQIAARLGGVTRNAVIGKVHRLKLSSRGPRDGRARKAEKDGKFRRFNHVVVPRRQAEPARHEFRWRHRAASRV